MEWVPEDGEKKQLRRKKAKRSLRNKSTWAWMCSSEPEGLGVEPGPLEDLGGCCGLWGSTVGCTRAVGADPDEALARLDSGTEVRLGERREASEARRT